MSEILAFNDVLQCCPVRYLRGFNIVIHVHNPQFRDDMSLVVREKTGVRGFRQGPAQTGLYNYIKWLEEEEGLYYPLCTDTADLRLCFRICKKPIFS